METSKMFNGKEIYELITKTAKDEAVKAITSSDKEIKTQVRRFYQEYVTIMSGIDILDNTGFLIKVKMLIPKAEYSKARVMENNSGKASSYYSWLIDNLKAINDKNDAKNFMLYYEAFIGFLYSELNNPKPNSNRNQNNSTYNSNNRNNTYTRK